MFQYNNNRRQILSRLALNIFIFNSESLPYKKMHYIQLLYFTSTLGFLNLQTKKIFAHFQHAPLQFESSQHLQNTPLYQEDLRPVLLSIQTIVLVCTYQYMLLLASINCWTHYLLARSKYINGDRSEYTGRHKLSRLHSSQVHIRIQLDLALVVGARRRERETEEREHFLCIGFVRGGVS